MLKKNLFRITTEFQVQTKQQQKKPLDFAGFLLSDNLHPILKLSKAIYFNLEYLYQVSQNYGDV
jgi:hypothetical protein